MTEKMAGLLVMADGTAIRAGGAGAPGIAVGELVFQTSMVGYQEALTDPSYAGQLLIFTYPLIGNYGVGAAMDQSARIQARGMIAGELMASAGHRDTGGDLDDLLRAAEVPALTGVDTRFLTRRVRTQGVILPRWPWLRPAGCPPSPSCRRRRSPSTMTPPTSSPAAPPSRRLWHPPARPDAPRSGAGGLRHQEQHPGAPARAAARASGWCPRAAPPPKSWPYSPTASCSPTAPATRPRWAMPSPPCATCWTPGACPSSASAWATNCCAGRGRRRRPRCASATAASTSRCLTDTGRVAITTQNHGYAVDAAAIPAGYRSRRTPT